jgi:Lipase (class 3)
MSSHRLYAGLGLLASFACVVALAACSTAAPPPAAWQPRPVKLDRALTSFDPQEAKDMLEFCVDLDSQDDLLNDVSVRHTLPDDSIYRPRVASRWGNAAIFDSRVAVNAKSDDPRHDAVHDPDMNGFGPYRNAWTLWKRTTPTRDGRDVYVIAIRGTVFTSRPTVMEDALTTTIPAQYGVEYPPGHYPAIDFAGDMPRAEVHAGFAYGTFSLLFDAQYGVLPVLAKVLKHDDDEIIVTGHSQGAAMATLTQAFFYQAMHASRPELGFGLAGKRYRLKSYVFAQPKPGNAQFAAAFSEITLASNNAFVFNNTLDSVPALPPTIEFLADATEDIPSSGNFLSRAMRRFNHAFDWVRSSVSTHVSNRVAATNAPLNEAFYMNDALIASADIVADTVNTRSSAVSQNFTSAGYVIPLRGDPRAQYDALSQVLIKPDDDAFVQHHAVSYRYLMEISFPEPSEAVSDASLKTLARGASHDMR